MNIKIVYSEKCLEYSQAGHPECPDRVGATYEYLKNDFEFIAPRPAEAADILTVHTRELLNQIETGQFYDGDSPAYPDLYSYAALSAGGAIVAAELALGGTASLSLMRPPGHHAGKGFLGGFCYFNNIAIAVVKALNSVDKVAIIDFDCHHGNGTEEIFMGHDKVLYVSLHQSPLYPGTGTRSELNCLNYPILAGTDEDGYLAELDRAIAEIKSFEPDMIAVSAGFDTFREDPITHLQLDIGSFEKIGQRIKLLGKPVFSILEGGYSAKMPQCVKSYLTGLDQ